MDPTKAQSSRTREGVLATLDVTIKTVNIAKDLVPIDIAKGVLTTVAIICAIVKDTMQNKDDFADVAKQCHEIGLRVWRAAEGNELSQAATRAIIDLQSSLDGILESLKEKSRRGLFARVVQISVDRQDITKWSQDLDRFINRFNMELNVLTNTTLNELVAMFEVYLQTNRQTDGSVMTEPPPAKPPVFYGRDPFVRQSVEALLGQTQRRHIALIGPGGIGKSSIAKAVINDDLIVEKFGARRFFVAFEFLESSRISFAAFLGRLMQCLGLPPSKADGHKLITRFLTTSDVFLILDNAETFLEAGQDTNGEIAAAIDGFGAHPSVAIMLTTRSSEIPPNLSCHRLDVPGLDPTAARQAFDSVCPVDQSATSVIDTLLSVLDFHPLSINLLAQAAVQNRWSPQELKNAWDGEQTLLLSTGKGKVQSLAVTIELSLKSRSVTDLGEQARDLLRLVAWLPQGVNRTLANEFFPDAQNIHTVIASLCKLSLTYNTSDGFVTMLAPIRLYVMDTFNRPADPPSLATVRFYYRSQLVAFMRQTGKNGGGAPDFPGLADDVNVERLIAYDLTKKQTDEPSYILCFSFLRYLVTHRRRPTGLGSVLMALPHAASDDAPVCGCLPFLPNMVSKGRRIAQLKAQCLLGAGYLTGEFVSPLDALDLFKNVLQLFRTVNDKEGMVESYLAAGGLQQLLGRFIEAEETYAKALTIAQSMIWFKRNEAVAAVQIPLSVLASFRGNPSKAEDLAQSARQYFEKAGNKAGLAEAANAQGFNAYFVGNNVLAKRHFHEAGELFKQAGNNQVGMAHALLSETSTIYRIEGPSSEKRVFEMLEGSKGLASHDFVLSSMSVLVRAEILNNKGEFDVPRSDIVTLLEGRSPAQKAGVDFGSASLVYGLGRVELLQSQDYEKAKERFLEAIVLFEALWDVRMKARCYRALGEIALLEQDVGAAKQAFAEASSLCDAMGISPEFLYACFDCFALPDKYVGWKMWQRDPNSLGV